jgi:hypothetical protein
LILADVVDDDADHLVLGGELQHLGILWLAAEKASHPHLTRFSQALLPLSIQWYFLKSSSIFSNPQEWISRFEKVHICRIYSHITCNGSKVVHQVESLALPHCLGLPYWHYQLVA